MISPLASDVRPGPTGTCSTGMTALLLRSCDDRLGAGRDHGRHAVGGGRGIAQIADDGAAALDLLGADEIGGLDDARPSLPQGGILAELAAGHRRADLKARCRSS